MKQEKVGEVGKAGMKEGRIKSSFGVEVFDHTGRNYQLVTLQNVGPPDTPRDPGKPLWVAYCTTHSLYPSHTNACYTPLCFLASGKHL